MNCFAADAQIISSNPIAQDTPESRYRAYEWQVSELVRTQADAARIHWDRVADSFYDGIPAEKTAQVEIRRQAMARHAGQFQRREVA